MNEPFQYGDYPVTKSTERYLNENGIGDPVKLVASYLAKRQAKNVKEPPKPQDLNDKVKDGINFDIARMI